MKPPKLCKYPNCKSPAWAKGYCKHPVHQDERTDSQYLRSKAKREEKRKEKKPRIRKVASKREIENKQYSIDRKEFLSRPENQMCRLYTWLEAQTIHHSAGRIGKLLLDQKYWIPLSMSAHDWVENHPEEAKELGLSVTRTDK